MRAASASAIWWVAPTSLTTRRQQSVVDDPHRQQHVALAGLGLRRQPVDRADPSGLLEALINVLQTGSSALTLADTNEEAAQQPGAVDPPVRSRRRRCRSPTSRTERFCRCCADTGETFDKPERRGFGPRRFFIWCLMKGEGNGTPASVVVVAANGYFCHCEEQSNEAIHFPGYELRDCFAEPVIGRAFTRPVGSQ